MTQEEFDTYLKNFLSPDTQSRNPEMAFMLGALIDAAAFQKVKDLLPHSEKAIKKSGQEQINKVRNNGIKFSEEEITLMPLKYRRVFAQGDRLVYYRQKPNGVYEARIHRSDMYIEASGRDFETMRKRFLDRLSAYYNKYPNPCRKP